MSDFEFLIIEQSLNSNTEVVLVSLLTWEAFWSAKLCTLSDNKRPKQKIGVQFKE